MTPPSGRPGPRGANRENRRTAIRVWQHTHPSPQAGGLISQLGLSPNWSAIVVERGAEAALVRKLGFRCAALAEPSLLDTLLEDPGREIVLIGARSMRLADGLLLRGYTPWCLHLPIGRDGVDDYLSRIDLESRANGVTGALSPEAQLYEFDHLLQGAMLFEHPIPFAGTPVDDIVELRFN